MVKQRNTFESHLSNSAPDLIRRPLIVICTQYAFIAPTRYIRARTTHTNTTYMCMFVL